MGMINVIFIVKSNDERMFYLYERFKNEKNIYYDDKLPLNLEIDTLLIPIDGICELGYIKGSNLKLENFLQNNHINKVYVGKKSKLLENICNKYQVTLISYYDDIEYSIKEFDLKLNVIKTFISEKLLTSIDDLKILVLGNTYKAIIASKKLGCDILEDYHLVNNNYDLVVNFSNLDLSFLIDQIIVEMKEYHMINLDMFLKNKKIFHIDFLMKHYLTKSSAKLLYDSVIKC